MISLFPSTLVAIAIAGFAPTLESDDALPRRGALGASFSAVTAEQATQLKIGQGTGLVARKPVLGLTAEKAGLKENDIITTINGTSVSPATVGAFVRELPAGKEIVLKGFRGTEPLTLRATLMEKPRDPGGDNYEVKYSHIVSNGLKMRTILTFPKKPGKHPAFFFIQGFSPVSYDFPLATSTGDVSTLDGPLLHDFANSNFVTIRVEKMGVGDSEGGPFAEVDYTTELDIYRQTLKQLKSQPSVDVNNIFIFGHSMGGAFGPMIATESPVKGIAVYGTAARTWYEYLMDVVRYQGLVGGGSFEDADDSVRAVSRLMALVFIEGKSVAEVKKSHPQLAQVADQFMPGGYFNGKTTKFWAQLGETNFAKYWAKVNCDVLAVRGASDFVTYDADHKLIADIVNRANPGKGRWAILPASDHLFHGYKTEEESMKGFSRGTYSSAFSKYMMDWMRGVMKGS